VLLPMMGFLFTLVVAGLCAGLVMPFFRSTRPWALVAALSLILAGVCAFALSWGLAFLLEGLHSQRLAGVAFFAGYCGGGPLGACTGAFIAIKLRQRGRHSC
jgi:hypothetical protein